MTRLYAKYSREDEQAVPPQHCPLSYMLPHHSRFVQKPEVIPPSFCPVALFFQFSPIFEDLKIRRSIYAI
jgi:hypothetical protein